MKSLSSLIFAIALVPSTAFSQFANIVVVEVENEGKVPGRTYQVYAGMTNVNDQVYVVFGDSLHPLEIKSTKPFYQCRKGGALAKQSNRKERQENDSLRFDSWITVGAMDNYDNNVNLLNIDLDDFEKTGGNIIAKKDGAWFCIPTDKQAYCKEDKRILLMQLTTQGEVNGKFSLMGKTDKGVAYTTHDIEFKCGEKKKKK